MRPPYGAINERVRQSLLQDHKLDVIMWSVDPLDWKRPGASVVTQRMVQGAKPGAILLAHDIHPGTIEAMPQTIAQLKAKGYGFATVSQLLALREPKVAAVADPTPAPVGGEPSVEVSGESPAGY
jgi:peptidoglycan/xylan/chitin deacetylase (PgdA/CDA1 family)